MHRRILLSLLMFVFPLHAIAFDIRSSDAFTPRVCTKEELGDGRNQDLKGDLAFTDGEILLHKNRVNEAVEQAGTCARSALLYQEEFSKVPEHFGFSPYYGASNTSSLIEDIRSISPRALSTNW
jgi:hypothetical protein